MKLTILDETGHTQMELQPEEAVEKINSTSQNYWSFVDGVYRERSQVTVTMLRTATEVVLTPALQAG